MSTIRKIKSRVFSTRNEAGNTNYKFYNRSAKPSELGSLYDTIELVPSLRKNLEQVYGLTKDKAVALTSSFYVNEIGEPVLILEKKKLEEAGIYDNYKQVKQIKTYEEFRNNYPGKFIIGATHTTIPINRYFSSNSINDSYLIEKYINRNNEAVFRNSNLMIITDTEIPFEEKVFDLVKHVKNTIKKRDYYDWEEKGENLKIYKISFVKKVTNNNDTFVKRIKVAQVISGLVSSILNSSINSKHSNYKHVAYGYSMFLQPCMDLLEKDADFYVLGNINKSEFWFEGNIKKENRNNLVHPKEFFNEGIEVEDGFVKLEEINELAVVPTEYLTLFLDNSKEHVLLVDSESVSAPIFKAISKEDIINQYNLVSNSDKHFILNNLNPEDFHKELITAVKGKSKEDVDPDDKFGLCPNFSFANDDFFKFRKFTSDGTELWLYILEKDIQGIILYLAQRNLLTKKDVAFYIKIMMDEIKNPDNPEYKALSDFYIVNFKLNKDIVNTMKS